MKQLISTVVALLAAQCILAHALWIETASTGARGQAQQIKILMAEAGEKPEPTEAQEWAAVKNFELYAIAPDGKQIKLSTTPQADYYAATFTPKTDGQYIILLKHENVGVLSFNPTHPFVPYMYATAQVLVGAMIEKATVTAFRQAPPLYLTATTNKEKKEVTIAIHNTKNKAVSPLVTAARYFSRNITWKHLE